MPYILVDEENSGHIQLYYEDQGTGPPVVLSHGWPLSGAAWERQVPVLLEAGYRVIYYDRRGFGASSKPASGYTYDTFVEDLDVLLNTLDLQDAVLVGHSMGSAEVAHYVGTYGSERVAKLALISVLFPYLLKTADNPKGVDKSVFDTFEAGIAEDRYAFLTQFLADFYNADVFGGTLVSDDAMHASWNLGAAASAKAFADCVPAWLTDFRADLPKIDIPTLLIHGTADRILPYESTAPLVDEALTDSKLVAVEDGPHGLLWTHADVVNGALIDFLQDEVLGHAF